jgi:hypothetical protein
MTRFARKEIEEKRLEERLECRKERKQKKKDPSWLQLKMPDGIELGWRFVSRGGINATKDTSRKELKEHKECR